MSFSLRNAVGIAAGLGVLYACLPGKSHVRRGQVAIITGGSRGLGLALAHRFGKAGLRLVIAARNQDELEAARDELINDGSVPSASDVLLVSCDLRDPDQARQLIAATLEHFGQLDILINDAGIIEVGPAINQPLETYRDAMQINFFAALYTTYAALPHFLEQKNGAIVNISSIGGKVAVPHLLPYVASKFALTGFSEGLHAELRHKGVRVTTVCPGLMRTGGEVHAHFHGQVKKEKFWFQLSARTPLLSTRSSSAADKIFRAVDSGSAEITISPQAWLAARFAGLAPETTQAVAGLIQTLLLPGPA